MSAATSLGLTLLAVIRVDPDQQVSDLDRFMALALPSFESFLAPGLVEEVVVVMPSRDVATAQQRLTGATAIPVRVVDEATIVPEIDPSSSGWTKQQVIKLAAAAAVRTPWLITLDADVLAARAIDRDFLFPGGRAIWQQELAGAHMDWWKTSARLLNSPTEVQPTDAVFGVTPALMHVPSLVGLSERIGREHPGEHWTRTLMATPGWTEYTLYWTYLLDTGTATELYEMPGGAHRPYSLDGSFWTPEDLSPEVMSVKIDAALHPDVTHAFFVFQSNLGRPLEETVSLVRPRIGGGPPTSDELATWSRHARTQRLRARLRPLRELRYRWRRR